MQDPEPIFTLDSETMKETIITKAFQQVLADKLVWNIHFPVFPFSSPSTAVPCGCLAISVLTGAMPEQSVMSFNNG